MRAIRWFMVPMICGLGAACIPAGGGGGGGDDDDGGPADSRVDPDDGIPPDMFIDPDDGIPPPDMFIDPDDGIPPPDMFIDPDDGIPPPDMFIDPDDGIPPPDMFIESDGGCQPSPERCNSADDDCDGAIDEGFGGLGELCVIGQGLCESAGTVICTPDGQGTVCDALGAEAADELCNGLDDDCDGDIDEAIEPVPCETGADGRCADGLEQCVGGASLCIAALDPVDELCDGRDDDCDGRTDEGTSGEACDTGAPGLCRPGVEQCVDGALLCDGEGPVAERCSGDDDDCDGAVDEGGVCDPCGGVQCPPDSACQGGECVPLGPGGARPIAALGGTIELAGALTEDDPVWQRLSEICVVREDGGFHYDALPVINLTGAPRTITATANWGNVDGFLHVFTAGFQPDLDAGCLGGDDDFNGTPQSQVPGIAIAPGQTLVIVPSTYGAGATIPAYTIDVQTLAGAPGGLICEPGIDGDGNGRIDCGEAGCDGVPACAVEGDLIPGVQQNVPDAEWQARGWQLCYDSLYSRGGDAVSALIAGCDGAQLMLACREVGAASLTLAAEGERADVLFDVGVGRAVSHNANDVEWYFSPDRAWGFAPGGEPIDLNSCDTGATVPELRMCIHLDPGGVRGFVDNGYRCGNNDLNNNGRWERLVLTR